MDTFSFTVSDGKGGSANETLAITVNRPLTLSGGGSSVTYIAQHAASVIDSGLVVMDPDGASLTAEAIQGTHGLFAKLDASSGAVEKITDVLADGGGFTLNRDGQKIAYLGQSLDHPGEVWTFSSGANQALTNTNPQVDTWQLGKVQEVSWAAKDKTRIYGVLVLPWNEKYTDEHLDYIAESVHEAAQQLTKA